MASAFAGVVGWRVRARRKARRGLTKEPPITVIDGKPVAYVDDVMAAVRSKMPGDSVTLQALDPGDKPPRTVAVLLAKLGE